MEKQYEAPAVVKVGSLVEMTLGSSTGTALDKSFPVGTPFKDLTFS